MLKKVLLTVVLALSFVAAIGMQGSIPPPECGLPGNPPCPWVN
jgi:hypothetical protein